MPLSLLDAPLYFVSSVGERSCFFTLFTERAWWCKATIAMSCASPLPKLSPSSSLYMYDATRMSLCRSSLDDSDPLIHLHSPFSFSFSPDSGHFLSSSPLSSSPAASRPVLTNIIPRHKNSPKSPLVTLNKVTAAANLQTISSPRKGCKENWEIVGRTQRSNAEIGRHIDSVLTPSSPSALQNSSRKVQRNFFEDGGAPADAVSFSSSLSSLKRKRPTKLAIPEFARLASFNKTKEFELPEPEPELLSCEASSFAVSSKRGKKDFMEDTHTVITNFQGKPNQAFFGVFDGHGGKAAAQFTAENLGRHIDMAIRQKGEEESLGDAMLAGYLSTDSEFLAKGLNSGACSISAFVKEGHLVVANAGDCKAVLCRDSKAEALSQFHRASNIDEQRRIENLGGYVDCFNGVWRLQGTLAVTRAFGDFNFKQWVSAEPEVKQLDITSDCEFLILASDGLWDKVSDQEAVDCAREVLQNAASKEKDASDDSPVARPIKARMHCHPTSPSRSSSTNKDCKETASSGGAGEACKKLIDMTNARGNVDDVTAMIILLKDFVMRR